MKVRPPNNAGSWYAGSASSLSRQIERECFLHPLGPGRTPTLTAEDKGDILGLLCPHAGYMYSGPVAAHSYGGLAENRRPEVVVIMGPNHTGVGSGVSIMMEGAWRTPLGDVAIATEVAKAIQRNSSYIDIDEKAHMYEHSIELQLPFLQFIYGSGWQFVPICMMLQDLDVATDVGQAMGKALQGRKAVVVASSDMSHYEPQHSAEAKDTHAIEAMKRLDEVALNEAVNRFNISMCGYGPAMSTIVAVKTLTANVGRLLKYATSGDTMGDRSAVVGYCAMAFMK
ncbi:MAG: AmmeMemoRadiSam system protein B [Candidatus Bathyarchaeia archaeon]